MKILAPGKLILSGEHSVVYGHPALAMAVNRYVTTDVSKQFFPFVSFDFLDFSCRNRLTFSALRRLKNQVKEKYQQFVSGKLNIRDILKNPVELAQFSSILLINALKIKLFQGIKLQIRSDIPVGCGMGSSAAMILSVIYAIAHHLRSDLSKDVFFRLGLEAENMQHGFSSGLDLQVSLNGGCLYKMDGEIQLRDIPFFSFFLVNTGLPASSTGECIEHVASFFKTSSIGDDFSAVTQVMDKGIQNNNQGEVMRAMRENHLLLTQIGVVPLRVQQFISEVEKWGAAKICGAGSVVGDQAGVVLVMTEDIAALQQLCTQFHYDILPVAGESRGVHVV